MTDELKPCLAYPCDGYMKENNYDASLECTSCQFIVADELEYSALVAGRQAAINAELESVAQALENGSFLHEHSPPAMLAREAAKVIRAKFGTNPLAEAQARIAELDLQLAKAKEDLRHMEQCYLDAKNEIAQLRGDLYREIGSTSS